jgi:biopolymer transport protein TolR
MVIVPVMPRGLAASLPSAGRASVVDEPPDRPIMVQVEFRSSHVIYRMNGVRVDKGKIVPLLSELLSGQTTRRIVLTADAGLDSGVVAEVIDAGRAAGVESLGLVTPGVRASAPILICERARRELKCRSVNSFGSLFCPPGISIRI